MKCFHFRLNIKYKTNSLSSELREISLPGPGSQNQIPLTLMLKTNIKNTTTAKASMKQNGVARVY